MSDVRLPLSELPTWAEQSKLDFRYAPPALKLLCRKLRLYPRYYAFFVPPVGGVGEFWVWNTKYCVIFDPRELWFAGALKRE